MVRAYSTWVHATAAKRQATTTRLHLLTRYYLCALFVDCKRNYCDTGRLGSIGKRLQRNEVRKAFYRWTRVNQTEKFRAMHNSIAIGLQSHLEDIRADVSCRTSTAAAAVDAVVAINRELHLLKNEQFRVIEEYQLRLLHIDKGAISNRKDLARHFLYSREKEIIAARSEAQILRDELDSLLNRLKHVPYFAEEESFEIPSGDTLKLNILSKPKALNVLVMELRRLQTSNGSLKAQVHFLKEQLAFESHNNLSQRRAIHFLEHETADVRARARGALS